MPQAGVLNYVVIRPITALIGFALAPFGLYKSGNVDPRNVRRLRCRLACRVRDI